MDKPNIFVFLYIQQCITAIKRINKAPWSQRINKIYI